MTTHLRTWALVLVTLVGGAGCATEIDADPGDDADIAESSDALTTPKKVSGGKAHALFVAMDRVLPTKTSGSMIEVQATKIDCMTSIGAGLSYCRIRPRVGAPLITLEGDRKAEALAEALGAIKGIMHASGDTERSWVIDVSCSERKTPILGDRDAVCTMKVKS